MGLGSPVRILIVREVKEQGDAVQVQEAESDAQKLGLTAKVYRE